MKLMQVGMVLTLLGALVARPAAAECIRPATLKDIEIARDAAIKAFRDMDQALFSTFVDRTAVLVNCLSEPLSPQDAAHFHELMMLDAFVREDDTAATYAIRSALAADPAYALPDDLIEEDHPLRLVYRIARTLATASGMRLTGEESEWVTIDGSREAEVPVPTDRPIVIQRMDAQGLVMATRFLQAGDQLPAWASVQGAPPPTAATPDPALAPAPKASPKERVNTTGQRPLGLLLATAGLGVATGSFYALAANRSNQFHDEATPGSDKEQLANQANALTWAWIGTGVGTVGLGTALVITW